MSKYENQKECIFDVCVTKICVTTNTMSLSVDVAIGVKGLIFEILNVSISNLENNSGVELPTNFHPHNLREDPAIIFSNYSDMIYFIEKVLEDLRKYPFVVKFFEPAS
jgi:hypothetical protein